MNEFDSGGVKPATTKDLSSFREMLENSKPIELDEFGNLHFSEEQEQRIAEAMATAGPQTRIGETRWYAELPPAVVALGDVQIPKLFFDGVRRYGEINPLTRERVQPSDKMVIYPKDVWAQIEAIAIDSNSKESEALIFVWGDLLERGIYQVEKVTYKNSGMRTESGTQGGTIVNEPGLSLIGLPHTHLASFSRPIWDAFSGRQDYAQALDASFEEEIGESVLTKRFFGVVTYSSDEGLHVGHYVFDETQGNTTFEGKTIRGQVCKMPGVFVEDGDKILFVQASLMTNTGVIGNNVYEVAKKGVDGGFEIEKDWQKSPENSQQRQNTRSRWH